MTPLGRSPPRDRGSRPSSALADSLKRHTRPAPWLPPRLRHPAAGYLAATFLVLLVVSLLSLLTPIIVPFVSQGAVLLLTIVLVALLWGEGPGLLATFLG